MATILEYFNNDFKDLSLDRTLNFTFKADDTESATIENIEIKERIRQDGNSDARLFTYYIPDIGNHTLPIIGEIINQIGNRIIEANDLVAISNFTSDKNFGHHSLVYASRIYIYTENLLTSKEMAKLDAFCKAKNIYVTVRSTDYTAKKMEIENPLAFISHDSRDKDLIARPLALGLSSRLCTVWYDEYSLKVGASLRESIEAGIKDAKKCILVLTQNYLTNPGWGKKEFNSIFTREMILEEKIILPIWHSVTKKEVYEYSPSLADTFALSWPSNNEKTDDEYKQEIQQLISKIHTAVTS